MIHTRDNLSPTALVAIGERSDYVASAAHYAAVARRIVAALRGGSRPFVLVTGDPPVDPQVLSEALGNVAGSGYAAIIIPCGPELGREDLERTVRALSKPKGIGGAAAEPGCSAPASPLFVFDDCDRLSDKQIEEVYKSTLRRDQMHGAAVLLAPLDFLVRLQRPALHFVKDAIAAQFDFQEVGDDESIAFLHDQLLLQRDRRAETRGFRRGILIGLAASGVVIAANIGVFILHPTAEQVCEAPASTARSSPVSEELSTVRPAKEAATDAAPTQAAPNAETTSLIATAPPPVSAPPSPPAEMEEPPLVALPSAAEPPVGPRLSGTDITALLARGDTFLSAGDITSARLFYERAADAGSGLAALRLGGTFEPAIPGRAGLRVTTDPAQALFWYRRARDLGVGEAKQRIDRLVPGSVGAKDMLSRQ